MTPGAGTGRRRGRVRIGCLIVLGTPAVFCAGVMLGRHLAVLEPSVSRSAAVEPSTKARVRNVFSPTIRDDPYVKDQHRKIVEGLELSCRLTREHCHDARAARAYLDAQK